MMEEEEEPLICPEMSIQSLNFDISPTQFMYYSTFILGLLNMEGLLIRKLFDDHNMQTNESLGIYREWGKDYLLKSLKTSEKVNYINS